MSKPIPKWGGDFNSLTLEQKTSRTPLSCNWKQTSVIFELRKLVIFTFSKN